MGVGLPSTAVGLIFDADPRLKVRDHARFMRNAFTAGAEFHFEHHVPWHFENFAGPKYGYFPRSRAYNARKLKQVGHNRPLEFTGASKRMATGSHVPIQATPKGATLTVRLAITGGSGRVLDAAAAARLFAAGKRKTATFTQRQINGQAQALRRVAEMEAITQDEINAVGRVMEQSYIDQANGPNVEYRKRIKVS